jgi:hypothetical protein
MTPRNARAAQSANVPPPPFYGVTDGVMRKPKVLLRNKLKVPPPPPKKAHTDARRDH